METTDARAIRALLADPEWVPSAAQLAALEATIPTTLAAGWEEYRAHVVMRGPHTPAMIKAARDGFYAGASQALALAMIGLRSATAEATVGPLADELDAFLARAGR
jgi:L-fucose mutarotase/ribose pyranase (RbsD/FucU family)